MTQREQADQRPQGEPATPMTCMDLLTDDPTCCLPGDTVVAAT
jgi:hypothetical protein